MQHYLGIDIAKLKFDCALLSPERTIKYSFPNTPAGFAQLLQWLRQNDVDPARSHAGLEATGSYGLALATFLHDHSFHVSVTNPARIKFFAQSLLARNKTDAADAETAAVCGAPAAAGGGRVSFRRFQTFLLGGALRLVGDHTAAVRNRREWKRTSYSRPFAGFADDLSSGVNGN